jgi:hypothetical protein
MTYIVLDPGETTGIARFDDKGTCLSVAQMVGIVETGYFLDRVLANIKVTRVLYETFQEFAHVKLTGSDMPAAQLIGIIKFLASKHDVPCEGIQPKYKKIGYAWSGKRPPSDHNKSHGPDAAALGEYWLRKTGVKGIND